jgi:hypothetical protein
LGPTLRKILFDSDGERITAVLRSPSATLHWVTCAVRVKPGPRGANEVDQDGHAGIKCGADSRACV